MLYNSPKLDVQIINVLCSEDGTNAFCNEDGTNAFFMVCNEDDTNANLGGHKSRWQIIWTQMSLSAWKAS